MKAIVKLLLRSRASSDVVLAMVMAAIVAAMIVPLPAWLLDAGLALNLTSAALLLVAALYAKDPLRVASFPTLLLITTLFRLALNVSSTRLALAEGHAGEIIQAFGEFVVRGEYVVGGVVFAILTLVQFLVVAKGAERVAEVSARFTLDAMPGKQMAIDADLRAGAIDQAQARSRRRELERESQMFGAMDGAMKFIKGDVIAGLVIVLVNLVGGIAVGALRNGMSAGEAASTYALIAIGDGLVSQIPSLCVAIAAGLVVTRVGSESGESSLGTEIGLQFFGQWRALFVVAALCGALAMIPGMPLVTFMVIGAAVAALGVVLKKGSGARTAAALNGQNDSPLDSAPVSTEPGAQAGATAPANVAAVMIDLSSDLSALALEDGGRFAKEDLCRVREDLFQELGVPVPPICVRTGAHYLPSGTYAVLLEEVPTAQGRLDLQSLYAVAPASDLAFLEVQGEEVKGQGDVVLTRVAAPARARLEPAHVRVLTPREVLCGHLRSLLRRRADALLGVQEVQGVLEAIEPTAPALVKEALNKVPLPLLTDVLRRLIQEQVSVRNIRLVLEALVSPGTAGDAVALAEQCRQALHRYISYKYAPTGPLFAYLVDPMIEEVLRESGSGGALSPEQVAGILENIKRLMGEGRGVLLVAPDVRRRLRKLIEGAFPEVAVLTYSELSPDLQIRPVGCLAAA